MYGFCLKKQVFFLSSYTPPSYVPMAVKQLAFSLP